MISPRLSSSYSCALIWVLLSWGIFGWGEPAFATAQTWPSGGSSGKVETKEEEFFDADDRDFDKRGPGTTPSTPGTSSNTEKPLGFFGAMGSAVKTVTGYSKPSATGVDGKGLDREGAQYVSPSQRAVETMTNTAMKTAAQAAQGPEVQKAAGSLAHTTAEEARRGALGQKSRSRSVSRSNSEDSLTSQQSTTSEKSTTSRKSLPSRAASQVSRTVKSGAKKVVTTVKKPFTKTPSPPKPVVPPKSKPSPKPAVTPKPPSRFSFPTPWKNKSIPVAKVPPMPRRPSNAPPPAVKRGTK